MIIRTVVYIDILYSQSADRSEREKREDTINDYTECAHDSCH